MVSEYINVLLLKKYICCSSLYKPNYFCVDLFSNHVRFWNTMECVLHWHCPVEYLLHPHECRVSYNCPRDKLRVNIWWDRIINMYMYFHFQCFKKLPLKLSLNRRKNDNTFEFATFKHTLFCVWLRYRRLDLPNVIFTLFITCKTEVSIYKLKYLISIAMIIL